MRNKVFPVKLLWLPKIILGLFSIFFSLLFLLKSSTVSAFQQNESLPLFDPLAQTSASECAPIDLVIAVDQSRSESITDPEDFRDEAAQLLITELLVNQMFECPDIQHRWAVINFGDRDRADNLGEADIVYEMNEFDTDRFFDENGVVIESEIYAFMNDIQNRIKSVPDSLVGTDFMIPFREALDQFESPRSEKDYKKVLIIITDGHPCARNGYTCDPDASGSPQMTQSELTRYMDDLYSQWQEDYLNQIDIYLIPINTIANYLDRQTTSFEFPTFRSYWEVMAKEIIEVQKTGRNVTKAVSEVSADFLGRNEVYDLVCDRKQGTFFMPPFQSRAQIIVLKDRPEDQFTLLYQLGSTNIAIQNGEIDPPNAEIDLTYLPLGRSEIYVMSSPVNTGEWGFEVTDCERVFVRVITGYIDPFLVSPPHFVKTFPDTPYYNESNPLRFQVRLDAEDSRDIRNDLAHTSSFKLLAWVWHESESFDQVKENPIELLQVPDTTLFESQPEDYVKTPKEGTYFIQIAGVFDEKDVVNPTRIAPYTIFDNAEEPFEFLSRPLGEFQVAIQSPQSSTLWQLNEVTPSGDLPLSIPMEFALLWPDGTLFDAETEGITADFEVTLQYANHTETIDWQPQDSIFVATLPPPPVGLAQSGEYTVKVIFNGSYREDVYFLGDGEAEVAFSAYTVTGIQPALNPITSQTVHPSFIAACPFVGGDVSEVTASAVLQVRRGDQMEVMSADEIAHLSLASPDTLLEGKLLRADGSVVQENLAFNYDGTQFNLTSPLTDLIEPGDYQFEVTLDPNNTIPDDYALIAVFSTQDFRRFNTYWTSPLTCGTGMGILAAIFLATLGIFLYYITGPLNGSLLLRPKDKAAITLSLSGINRRNPKKFSNEKLKNAEIGRVLVTPIKDDENKSAIRVETYDLQGSVLDEVELSGRYKEEKLFDGFIRFTGK